MRLLPRMRHPRRGCLCCFNIIHRRVFCHFLPDCVKLCRHIFSELIEIGNNIEYMSNVLFERCIRELACYTLRKEKESFIVQ